MPWSAPSQPQFLVATLLVARSSGWVTLFLHHSGCVGWALAPGEEGAQAGGKLPRSACQGMHTGTERGTKASELNYNHQHPGNNHERQCREHPCGMGPWWGGSRGPGARAVSAAAFLWLLGLHSAVGRSPDGFQGLKSRWCLAPVCSREEVCP